MIILSVAGLLVFGVIALCISENRRQNRLKIAVIGIILQIMIQ
jgi:nucleoside permease NupC